MKIEQIKEVAKKVNQVHNTYQEFAAMGDAGINYDDDIRVGGIYAITRRVHLLSGIEVLAETLSSISQIQCVPRGAPYCVYPMQAEITIGGVTYYELYKTEQVDALIKKQKEANNAISE